MRFAVALLFGSLLCHAAPLDAQEAQTTEAQAAAGRHITLQEAVQMALAHNHNVRLAGFKVQEKRYAKDEAKSAYFPSLKNESSLLHITDLEHVEVPAGAFGTVDGSLIPAQTITLFQGKETFETSGTSLSQPLTPLLKVKAKNDMALADLNATRDEASQTRNQVALKVRQVYYGLLIAQLHHQALEAGVSAAKDAEEERAQQVKYGSSLDQALIETRAQSLQSKQELLTADLQISDATTQLNDLIGLPLETQLVLDASVPEVREPCRLEECKQAAVKAHPEIKAAEEQVNGAAASVRLAKRQYLPDTEVFARYSYQNNVPFLVHNFGTFGFLFSYDIFDGGKRHAAIEQQKSELDEANENLARVKDEIELQVQIAYNKLERTREMVSVSQELLSLRDESYRVVNQQLNEGEALQSQEQKASAQELDAKAALLQSQLDYAQAQDELAVAMGQTPE